MRTHPLPPQKVEEEEHLKIYGGLRERSTSLRKKLKVTISNRRSRPTREKEEVYQ